MSAAAAPLGNHNGNQGGKNAGKTQPGKTQPTKANGNNAINNKENKHPNQTQPPRNTRSKTKDDGIAQVLEAIRNIDPKQTIADAQKPFNDIVIKLADCLNTLQGRIGILEAENDKKTTTIKGLEDKVTKLQGQIKANNHNQSAQRKEMESFAAVVKNSESVAKRQEVEKSKNSIFIRGLPKHDDAKGSDIEAKDQTIEVVQNWTQILGTDVKINDAKRLKPKDKKSAGAIIVNFASYSEKAQIYKALSRTREDKTIPKPSVCDVFPAFLKDTQKKLEKLSYLIRQENPYIKTRIVLQGTDLVLKKKQGKELVDLEEDDYLFNYESGNDGASGNSF